MIAGFQLKVSSSDDEQILGAEQALMAIGFRPNTRGLGLDELGSTLRKTGLLRSMTVWPPTYQEFGQLATSQPNSC